MALLHLTDRVVDLDARRITGPSAGRLTDLEARVLAFLVDHRDRAVSRDELLVEVWGYTTGVQSRAPDTLVKQLRRKLEVDPRDPVLLTSVYGEGYRWSGPGRAQAETAHWQPRREGFFGRTAASEEVRAWLVSDHPLLAVVGPPGAGTSRLVQQIVGDAPVVVRWVPGSDAAWLRDALAARLGGSLTAAAPTVVVVDGLDNDGLSAVAEDVLPVLSGDGLRLCVTAHRPPSWPGVRVLRLGPLSDAVGLALLDQRVAQSGATGPIGSDPIRRALVTSVAGLPGDIEAVARALATAGPDEVLSELRTDPDGFWRASQAPALAPWRDLDRDARRFLQAASSWPAPVRRDHALAATGVRPATLRQLEQEGLIAVWRDARGHSRLAVPGRVRAALPEVPLERSNGARAALWAVVLDHVLDATGLSDGEMEDHAPLLLAAASDPSVEPDVAVDVVWRVFDLLDRAGTYRQTVALLRSRRPVTTRAAHRRDAALAAAWVRLHQLDSAEAAGLRATAPDEPLVRVRAWSSVGSARAIRGDTKEALPAFEEAAAIDIPASSLRLQMTDNLAAARLQLGDFSGGIAALEANVGHARRMGGGARLASILTNLTGARAAAGDAEGALRAGHEALQLHETLGDPRLCAFDHANLAVANSRTSAVSKARVHVDAAMVLTPRFDDPRLRAWIDLAEVLVRCAEGRGSEARAAMSRLLAGGGVARAARGGGELLDALVALAEDPSTHEQARAALRAAPSVHGARLLMPSLQAALARLA
jgi:DNA-binding winged helix-turn-helix (wHTH) protein/tetratricopeptide (TPR) repeat protein